MQQSVAPGMRINSFRALTGIAETPAGCLTLKQLLSGTLKVPGVELRQLDRWNLIGRLVALNDPDAATIFSSEQQRDKSGDGQKYAWSVQAGSPTTEAKETYFAQYLLAPTDPKAKPEDWLTQSLRPFNSWNQSALTEPYLRRALDQLSEIKRDRKIFFLGAWLGAFIGGQQERSRFSHRSPVARAARHRRRPPPQSPRKRRRTRAHRPHPPKVPRLMAAAHETIRIGVDTGGTFTDLLCLDSRGLRVHKLRSVPSDPASAILAGIRALLETEPSSVSLEVTHGSTVATNAVLERKGARLALITTAGFEDVIRIGRQTRPELYNFMVRRAEPLVSPELTFGLRERIGADGSVLTPLDPAELTTLIATLREKQIDSVAVCFLHSYAFPQHEQQAAAALRYAGFRVSTSHEVLPEYREYERWATTAVNAYVAPLMARYLGRLQEQLGSAKLRIMQSNGGSISAARAATEAVQTILSGPAAGVIGAQALGALSGHSRLITFDMGGTSTDVSLVDGVIATTSESLVGDLPVRLPVLDIHTVGAGGGSIAWQDAAGGLRVGPRSAGADPGPVCFGTGTELTVTDANLLLGRLDSSYFLGGRLTLDLARTQSIATDFAAKLNLTVPALAEGILRIANANMERAVRVVSVQRGFDPRDFALLAFGGAGGLHACDLAVALDIATVLIPEHSGVLSALGMLLADVAKDYSASVLRPGVKLTAGDLQSRLSPLAAQAQHDLAAEGFVPEDITLTAALAMRYQGQAFEIDVPLPAFTLTEESLAALETDFHERHAKLYGYSNPHRATEAVQLTPPRHRPHRQTLAARRARHLKPQPLPTPDATRTTIFAGESLATPIFHRNRLTPGMAGVGPAIIVTGESTNVIPPRWSWQVDSAGTLVATNKGGAA